MKTRFRVLGRLGLTVILLWLGIGLSIHCAFGQTVPNAPVAKTYTNKTFFHLPIEIDKKARASVREVILYVKEGTGSWLKKEVAPATQSHFTYQVAKDGEYWFSVVTVDTMGRSNPADVTKEPPALVVVVDTTPPAVDLSSVNMPGGEMGIRCTIKDVNPDYKKLQLSYQGTNQLWQPLEPMPGTAGLFRLPNLPVLNGTMRYTVVDRAGNHTTQEVTLKEQLANVSPTAKPDLLPVAKAELPQVPKVELPQESAQKPVIPPPNDLKLANHETKKNAQETQPVPPLPKVPTPTVPSLPVEKDVEKIPSAPPPMLNPPAPIPPITKSSVVSGNTSRQLINTQHAMIDYRLDKVGPSGVGKVDIWMKGENSGAWQHLATDPDRKTPVEVKLPHEGLFGIRLAVTNGNGFGGSPPQPADVPTFWIEVDTTPPFAQLQPIGPITGGGNIDIHWTATDKNLGPDAVNLLYAMQKNGPWHPIARQIKNSGEHSWQFPRDAGSQFFIRLEVTDEAGNVTRCELPTPIILDLSEPQGQVIGVTSVSSGIVPVKGQ